MDCEVETGSPYLVMTKTVTAEAKATIKAPDKLDIAPSLPRVWLAPDPLDTAPIMTKILMIIAACLNLTTLAPTAVPKRLAASLAPRDQPKKRPLAIYRIDKSIESPKSLS